jgi:hypothetical protein
MLADVKFEAHAKNFFDCDDFENDWALFAYDRESKKDRKDVYDFASWEKQPELKSLFEQKASQNDVLLVHYLIPGSTPFLSAMSQQIPIVIQFWGGDYVSQLMPLSKTLLPLTQSLVYDPPSKPSWLKSLGRKALEKFRQMKNRKNVLDALEIASGFLTILPEEKSIFPKKYHSKHLSARVIYGNFASVPTQTGDSKTGLSIILGNSATPSNNHLDFLKLLSTCPSPIDHLILPLSYGDSSYGKVISARFEESSLNTIVLKNLMPLHEYEALMNQVDVLIMGHLRQQGLGNILKALQQGKTVYLHPEGVNYRYFKTRGFAFGNTQKLSRDVQMISKADQHRNAELVSQLWDIENGRVKMKAALTSLLHSTSAS